MGYQRSKSSNALETPKKSVTFMKNKNVVSNENNCQDRYKSKIKDKETIKTQNTFIKTKSCEHSSFSGSQKCNVVNVGTPLKKKSFSLMSLVAAKKTHDVTINPAEKGLNDDDLDERNNEIREKQCGVITQPNIEKGRKVLIKVVSPSEQCVNPTTTKYVNGASTYTSVSVPSLSSKVLRYVSLIK